MSVTNVIADDSSKANLQGSYFASVYGTASVQADVDARVLDVPFDDYLISFSEYDTYVELTHLRPKLSITADGLLPVSLKTFVASLSGPLFMILDRSYRDGQVRELFRRGIDTPIFEEGRRADPVNYRPVTQASIVCSILERLVVRHITRHVSTNQLLDQNQHGFVHRPSTCTQILHMSRDWCSYINSNVPHHCIHFDQKSAFEKVPHALLLAKASRLGLHARTVNWIRRLLQDRFFGVRMNRKFSRSYAAPSGLPQGSWISLCPVPTRHS